MKVLTFIKLSHELLRTILCLTEMSCNLNIRLKYCSSLRVQLLLENMSYKNIVCTKYIFYVESTEENCNKMILIIYKIFWGQ